VILPPELKAAAATHSYPLLSATISGAHLYGFPSPDSDYDLRGVHVLPVRSVIGLDPAEETVEIARRRGGFELDLVTHDVKKFCVLMLRRNGYVLEQLYSPLVVHTTAAHEELKAIGKGCITRFHSHHYLGFAETQWKLFDKERPRRLKPLLYLYRVLLTGIHLMRTGEIEANLPTLNQDFHLPYIEDLIRLKTEGSESAMLPESDVAFHFAEFNRLRRDLEEAAERTALPRDHSAKPALHDFVVRTRLVQFG
jgi:predicted nucleotidyltransferase